MKNITRNMLQLALIEAGKDRKLRNEGTVVTALTGMLRNKLRDGGLTTDQALRFAIAIGYYIKVAEETDSLESPSVAQSLRDGTFSFDVEWE